MAVCPLRRDGRWFGFCRRATILLLAGPSFATALASAEPAQEVSVATPQSGGQISAHVAQASRRFDIPEHWIRAILHVESAGDHKAISPAGALGLMQIMPGTWAELRSRHRLGDDPFEPRDNIFAGAAYLREMFDRYGNIGAVLAAYNAGPARYDQHLATGRSLPAETHAYVARLTPRLARGLTPPDDPIAKPSPGNWRAAPLFGRRSTGANAALQSQVDHIRIAASDARGLRKIALEPSRSGALFAAQRIEQGAP